MTDSWSGLGNSNGLRMKWGFLLGVNAGGFGLGVARFDGLDYFERTAPCLAETRFLMRKAGRSENGLRQPPN